MSLFPPNYYFSTKDSKLRWCTSTMQATNDLLLATHQHQHAIVLPPSVWDAFRQRYSELQETHAILNNEHSLFSGWSAELWALVEKCLGAYSDVENAMDLARVESRIVFTPAAPPSRTHNANNKGGSHTNYTSHGESTGNFAPQYQYHDDYATVHSNNKRGSKSPKQKAKADVQAAPVPFVLVSRSMPETRIAVADTAAAYYYFNEN
ncbi:hypothetical protein BJ138DRAFT_1153673 [Hygrophoropsis aurantiaca]|uniref:Uncharacterized protein n=1 Tax=Hygrophoropsis aurantiaca TaxID=72124 RepID=A0ACB8AA27_9AGAM|nr:hypothetical protein BJ138DRAFT_1153673 [Hygrophoropsis aurantiaca]